MNTRERFLAVMNFQPVDRLPVMEWAVWWCKTVERWQSEGLPVTDRYDIMRYFNLDMNYHGWILMNTPDLPPVASHGASMIHNIDDYIKLKKYLYPAESVRLDP